MKANELRIGNYILLTNDNFNTSKVYVLDGFDIYKLDESDCFDIEPIPLTKEWLLRMGFEFKRQKVGANGIFSKGELNLTLSYGGIVYRKLNRPVLYVHSLQNLYFALTEDELTINES